MQDELQAEYPMLDIQLLAVNERGQEFGNASMSEGRDLPLLQDVDSDGNGRSDVWADLWNVEWRDVVVLDGQNQKVAVYNLTDNDLANSANFEQLRNLILHTAIRNQRPWCNPVNHLDINDDGQVTAGDAHALIDSLNQDGVRALGAFDGEEPPGGYYDTDLDGIAAPIDVLLVINFLLNSSNTAEAEGEALLPLPRVDQGFWVAEKQESAANEPAGHQTVLAAAGDHMDRGSSFTAAYSLERDSVEQHGQRASDRRSDDPLEELDASWRHLNASAVDAVLTSLL